MSELISVDELNIGQTIAFKTHNAYDNVEWRGTIVGIGDYSLVRKMDDLLPYYQNVKKSQTAMGDIETLSYLILDVYENAQTVMTNRRIFAKEWIDVSTLKIISITDHIDVRVFGTTSRDKQKILDILSDAGYSVTITASTM